MAMMNEGTSEKEARSKIWLVDSKGLIVKDRPEGGITGHKTKFAHARSPIKTLTEAVKTLKPNILIGKFDYQCIAVLVYTIFNY